jgi:hypothetical protein
MGQENRTCPLSKLPCATPDICNAIGDCEGKDIVHQYLEEYTTVINLARLGTPQKLAAAEKLLGQRTEWVKKVMERRPDIADAILREAERRILDRQ